LGRSGYKGEPGFWLGGSKNDEPEEWVGGSEGARQKFGSVEIRDASQKFGLASRCDERASVLGRQVGGEWISSSTNG